MRRMASVFVVACCLAMACACATADETAPTTPTVGAAGRGIADFPELSAEKDWPWWRGPTRNGIAAAGGTPVRWSPTENIAWQTPVPGRGHSSPIVVGDRIYLTTADETQQTQVVLAFDRRTGESVWSHEVNHGALAARIHRNNTHATPTIACDGQRLFVVFVYGQGVHATALDLAGRKLWQEKVGQFDPQRYEYGYGPSPVLYRGTVIVAAESDDASFMVALDRRTGREVWRVPRPMNISYSTPSIAHVAGRDQLFMSGADRVMSYDPNSGRELWSTPATTAATCGTAVWDADLVFASGGYPKSETAAIRADGSGQVVWKNAQKCYEQSLLAFQGHVYGLTDGGILYCWGAKDGQEKWRQRLQGPVSASPVLAGGHIYWANERGMMYVFRPNPDVLELVAENQLGDSAYASPAVSQGQIFLRVGASVDGERRETLYCIGKRP